MSLWKKIGLGFLCFVLVNMVFIVISHKDYHETQKTDTKPSSVNQNASIYDKPLEKVQFSGKSPANFSGNCKAITSMLNKLLNQNSASCLAKSGVVMIRAAKGVIDKNPGFPSIAMAASGWAVNEDYYSDDVKFVVQNNPGKNGCLMIAGNIAAFIQDEIKNNGKDLFYESTKAVASSKPVECPDFLK